MRHDTYREPCGHESDAAHPLRVEYCPARLYDSSDDIVTLTETIDEVLTSVNHSSYRQRYTADRLENTHVRDYEFDVAPNTELARLAIYQLVSIQRQHLRAPSRMSYTIESSWRVVDLDATSAAMRQEYIIDIYPNGEPQCAVTELDLESQKAAMDAESEGNLFKTSTRPMVAYDLHELSKLCSTLQSHQTADNHRL